ncbi:hypothetical protein ACU686_04640 [Yinghuangia aomiensis]
MLSGNTPVVVGPDGPSLGGFAVPAAVIRADRWKLAQLRPDDRVRLVPVTPAEAARANRARAAGTRRSPRRGRTVGGGRAARVGRAGVGRGAGASGRAVRRFRRPGCDRRSPCGTPATTMSWSKSARPAWI